ncbi:MAG: zinc-ribbon domain-containing protein [Clostridiales bacterium]|nr:zinc-ribbon domain-containing protein [Clostridiales bacterium]
MKYCKSCGAELVDEAVICPKCGVAVEGSVQEKGQNKLGLVGFILSFFTGPVAFILSLIGLIQGKKNGEKVGFAIAGLVLSAISLVFAIIIWSSLIGSLASGVYGFATLALL